MNIERNPTDTRQAAKTGTVRYVLMASLFAAIIAMAIIYAYFFAA